MVHLWATTHSLTVFLILASALYLQQALAHPSTSGGSALERRDFVVGTLDICNYNDEAFERPIIVTAFTDAREIASAAVQYKWGNEWQGVMDYYFGTTGCNNVGKQNEVTGAFENAKNVEWALGDSHWFYQNVIVYVHEKGGVGIWGKPRCVTDPEMVLYQVIDYGYLWNDYHLVLCERFWDQVKGGDAYGWQLRTIAGMVKYVEDQNEAGHDYTQDATTLWGTTGGTILKELHQFGQFISQRKYGTQEFASYPPNVAGFAADIGCGIFPEGKSWDAEWAVTSINNADSYRTASEAMYWSGVFKLPTGTFPKPPQLYDFSNANLTSELPKLMSETRIFSHVTFPSPTSNDYITLPATVTEPAYSLTTLTPAWSCHSGSDLENQNPSLEDGGDWACTCSLGGALYGTLELGLIPAASWSGTECPTTSTDLPFLQATTVTTTETPTCTFSIEHTIERVPDGTEISVEEDVAIPICRCGTAFSDGYVAASTDTSCTAATKSLPQLFTTTTIVETITVT